MLADGPIRNVHYHNRQRRTAMKWVKITLTLTSYLSVTSAGCCRRVVSSVSPHYIRLWNSSKASWRVRAWTTVADWCGWKQGAGVDGTGSRTVAAHSHSWCDTSVKGLTILTYHTIMYPWGYLLTDSTQSITCVGERWHAIMMLGTLGSSLTTFSGPRTPLLELMMIGNFNKSRSI